MKRTHITILALLAVSACTTGTDYSPMWQQIESNEDVCYDKKKMGKFKTAVQFTNCMEEAAMPLYVQYKHPSTIMVRRFYAKHRVISEKLDAKKISKAEANAMVEDLMMEMAKIEQQELDRQYQRDRDFIQDMNQLQQNINASKPLNCQSHTYNNHTSTTCY